MARLRDVSSPNFLFLTYDLEAYCVTNFFAVPTYFLDSSVIEERMSFPRNFVFQEVGYNLN